MNLLDFITTIFCLSDDLLPEDRLRQRGFAPTLYDSEVLTMEIVGEFLGMEREIELYRYFRRHHAGLFPSLRRIHRTSFTRQAANLWKVKELLWQRTLRRIRFDPLLSILDSMPLPICRFNRASRCHLFAGAAAYGKDSLQPGTFYGFKLHLKVCWPGVITAFELVPGNFTDITAAPDLLEGAHGWVLGDRGYWGEAFHAEMQAQGVQVLAPFQTRKHERRAWPFWLTLKRRRIESVLSQLVERFRAKRTWARDLWHLCSRWLRKVLAHTVGVFLCQQLGLPDLHLSQVVSD